MKNIECILITEKKNKYFVFYLNSICYRCLLLSVFVMHNRFYSVVELLLEMDLAFACYLRRRYQHRFFDNHYHVDYLCTHKHCHVFDVNHHFDFPSINNIYKNREQWDVIGNKCQTINLQKKYKLDNNLTMSVVILSHDMYVHTHIHT